MNRITLVIIGILVLSLIGVTTYYGIKLRKLNLEKLEQMQTEIDKIKLENKNIINIDSIASAIEAKAFAREDSITEVWNKQLSKMKYEYRYELKKRDQDIESRLDSIARILPSLPNY